MVIEKSTSQDHVRSLHSSDSVNSSQEECTDLVNLSSAGGSDFGNKDKEVKNDIEISKKESREVNRWRFTLFLALLVITASISVIVYYITKNGQFNEFDSQYLGATEQLTNAFIDIVVQNIAILGSLRSSTMAYENDLSNSSWPFVTLSSFSRRSSTVLLLSKSLNLAFYPIVQDSEKTAWENYIVQKGEVWVQEALEYDNKSNRQTYQQANATDDLKILPIYYINETGIVFDEGPGPYAPVWQMSPYIPGYLNFNTLRSKELQEVQYVLNSGKAFFGEFKTTEPGGLDSPNRQTVSYARFVSAKAQKPMEYDGDVLSLVMLPLYRSFKKDDKTTVAILSALIRWKSYFENVLPIQSKGVVCVIDNSCQGAFSYLVEGNNVTFLGKGDLHEKEYSSWVQTASLADFSKIEDGTEFGIELNNTYCPVTLKIYPTKSFYDEYVTSMPLIMTLTVVIMFFFTVVLFIIYDRQVERRQYLVLTKAIHTTNIVTSLFPQKFAKRILDQENDVHVLTSQMSTKNKLKSFLSPNDIVSSPNLVQPIADLFLHTTVMFADICGFTAWSSSREPSQVFVLLQGVYQAFDTIAKRRKVFKVETIGDSYVAVTGLPDPQPNHALIMARFATECLQSMRRVAGSLNSSLGPGTSDLTMRIGMHSGPVTGGVLVGEKARFQLFGDTVNTASRMESTGVTNRIQISPATASLIVAAGKSHWISPREDHVKAKGKGILKTFWLNVQTKSSSEYAGSDNATSSDQSSNSTKDLSCETQMNSKMVPSSHELHIDWVCELLQNQISKIVATRPFSNNDKYVPKSVIVPDVPEFPPMDEVVEAIAVPEITQNSVNMTPINIELSDAVVKQLRHLVSAIASTYNNNPFHNFDHACHVTMSVVKLLMRVVTPELEDSVVSHLSNNIHNYTHGISDDPVTQLAILFSAIIHDADHRGVSNNQLIQENVSLATKYRSKSVAEQNSLDIAWSLLISEEFKELRCCIFATEAEIKRFRQVVVNAVLATDIFDKELNDLRKQRWQKAFTKMDENQMRKSQEQKNLQATIVIEHIMQASDVAHTMQHWHVYRKWNANLFKEMYIAYQTGRLDRNPGEFWYKGELAFFDNYIIPLAKKLKECNVFGVFSDEYLNYAEKNRAEWEGRGKEIIAEMMAEI